MGDTTFKTLNENLTKHSNRHDDEDDEDEEEEEEDYDDDDGDVYVYVDVDDYIYILFLKYIYIYPIEDGQNLEHIWSYSALWQVPGKSALLSVVHLHV